MHRDMTKRTTTKARAVKQLATREAPFCKKCIVDVVRAACKPTGVTRVAAAVGAALRDDLEKFMRHAAQRVLLFTQHSRRKTVSPQAVRFALEDEIHNLQTEHGEHWVRIDGGTKRPRTRIPRAQFDRLARNALAAAVAGGSGLFGYADQASYRISTSARDLWHQIAESYLGAMAGQGCAVARASKSKTVSHRHVDRVRQASREARGAAVNAYFGSSVSSSVSKPRGRPRKSR